MSQYVKNKPVPVNLITLQAEINSNGSIVPSCTSITDMGGSTISLEFAADLSPSEETALDTVLSEYVYAEPPIPMSIFQIQPETGKLAVQASAKPLQAQQTYAVWSGSGDDVVNHLLGEGTLLDFNLTPGVPSQSIDIKFDPTFGKVWINEGYMRFADAGLGDCLSAYIIAPATQLQTIVSKDLVVNDHRVSYSTGGPGTGTHGFAATPTLVPRTFSKDGDWDYNGVSLTPNFAGTGLYRMYDIEYITHKYINRIPVRGTVTNFINLASDDTASIPHPYFIRLTCYNNSNTTWNLQAFVEIYRERTCS